MTISSSAHAAPSARIVLSCSVQGADSDDLAVQICARLKLQMEKTTRAQFQVMANGQGPAAEGQRGASVFLRVINAHRASVQLTVGAFAGGVLQMQQQQSLELDVQDARLSASAATALAHPLIQMLGLDRS